MKKTILWLHGWSFTAEVWQALHDLIPEHHHHTLSYQSCSTAQQMVQLVSDTIRQLQPDLIVGWSLGATLAFRQHDLSGTPVLVLSGTLRFTDTWPARVLNQMIRKLQQTPQQVLHDFRRHLGVSPVLSHLELVEWPIETLSAGLEVLRDTDHSTMRHLRGLWMHGTSDPLMKPPENLPTLNIEGAGHLLMISHPQQIAEQIRSLL